MLAKIYSKSFWNIFLHFFNALKNFLSQKFVRFAEYFFEGSTEWNKKKFQVGISKKNELNIPLTDLKKVFIIFQNCTFLFHSPLNSRIKNVHKIELLRYLLIDTTSCCLDDLMYFENMHKPHKNLMTTKNIQAFYTGHICR